jgi:hypothetical protein
VVVHVDAETLREHTAGRCEIEQGPALPVETVRRLSCDSSLLRVLENEHGEPLAVGRKTRTIPAAIRRALNTRGRTAGRPTLRTSSPCAACIIAWFTRARSPSRL